MGIGDDGIMNPSLDYNPVISYVTQDLNTGDTVVVNVTQPGHGLWPGYVVRTVSPTPSGGSVVNNYGEGIGGLQGPNSPVATEIDNTWIQQTGNLARKCACGQ
jgi:hypothetical protein